MLYTHFSPYLACFAWAYIYETCGVYIIFHQLFDSRELLVDKKPIVEKGEEMKGYSSTFYSFISSFHTMWLPHYRHLLIGTLSKLVLWVGYCQTILPLKNHQSRHLILWQWDSKISSVLVGDDHHRSWFNLSHKTVAIITFVNKFFFFVIHFYYHHFYISTNVFNESHIRWWSRHVIRLTLLVIFSNPSLSKQ